MDFNISAMSTKRAAEAAVIHLIDFFFNVKNELMVYTDFAEFVNDNSDMFAMFFF